MDTNNEDIRYTNVHMYRGSGDVDQDKYIYSPPAWRMCPVCCGQQIEYDESPCKNCRGTGRIPVYYTPEQWQEAGGHLCSSIPVWFRGKNAKCWHSGLYENAQHYRREWNGSIEIIIATEAGRPPEEEL